MDIIESSPKSPAEEVVLVPGLENDEDGTRIVSAENLAHTWQPQVAISAVDDYGLGWIVSDFNGLTLLSHAGNTIGFTSEFAFLPEHDLGVVVLTNQRVSMLNTAIVARLFEMLFEQPYAAEDEIMFSFAMMRDQYTELGEDIEQTVPQEAAEVAVGLYTNDALGDVTIRATGDSTLIFDAGEFESELWLYTGEEDEDEDMIVFLLYDPPINGLAVRFEPDDTGEYQMLVGEGVVEYAFERVD